MTTTKNSVLTLAEIDAATGQEVIRELTAEELAQFEILNAETEARKAAEAAKAAARQSALAKLAELGLTEEEIAAL